MKIIDINTPGLENLTRAPETPGGVQIIQLQDTCCYDRILSVRFRDTVPSCPTSTDQAATTHLNVQNQPQNTNIQTLATTSNARTRVKFTNRHLASSWMRRAKSAPSIRTCGNPRPWNLAILTPPIQACRLAALPERNVHATTHAEQTPSYAPGKYSGCQRHSDAKDRDCRALANNGN